MDLSLKKGLVGMGSTSRRATNLAILFALLLAPGVVLAQARLALVIGIDGYQHLPDLVNAGNDARALSGKLKALDFDVILREGATRRDIYRAISEFETRLANDGGTGLVFFAGHGIQADGRNYLIPSDAQVEIEDDLEAEAIDAARILESMARAGNPLNILVLDACRDNPLPRRTRSASRGLTVTSIPSGAKGTAILYAAGEGQVAQDGPPGGHGVFTEALLDALETPNLKLEEVIKEVTRNVLQQTNGRQRPWSLASIQGDFFFNRQKIVVDVPASATPSAVQQASRTDVARDVWQAIKDSGNRELMENFSRRFADTPYAMAAEAQLAMLAPQEMPAKAIEPKPKPVAKVVEEVAGIRKFGPHEMVAVKTDCFGMGTHRGYPRRDPDEDYHRACVRDFLIDRYEVTFEAYDAFAKATGRDLPDDDGMGRGRRPVINVDWDDARAYAAWASEQYGAAFRLPTEAEWEYACTSGGEAQRFCGSNDPSEVAVFDQRSTLPVGSRKPNALGLYDMSGNAWEMTCSPYDYDDVLGAGPARMGRYSGSEEKCVEENPHAGHVSLVFRGGDWESGDDDIRSTNRRVNITGAYGGRYISQLGFRLVANE